MKTIIPKALDLLENGYEVIPVTKSGEPLLKGALFEGRTHTIRDVLTWEKRFPDASLALVCGSHDVYALDIDVDNRKLSRQLLRMIKSRFSNVPVRVCNVPRFAVLFRASEDLQTVTNAHSKGYKTADSKSLQQIELMGKKLLTVEGIHRKTGNRYRWGNVRQPLHTHIDDLPEFDLKFIESFFTFFESHVPESFHKVSESTFSKHVGETTFDNVVAPRIYQDEEVEAILSQVKGDDRESWIRVGMALHTHYDGSKKGLVRWDEWSSQFEGYRGIGDCRKNWKTFKAEGGLTLGGLVKKKVVVTAPECETEDYVDELDKAIKTLVAITKDMRVGDLSQPPTRELPRFTELNFSRAHEKCFVEKKDPRTGETSVKAVPLMTAWKESKERIVCADTIYTPIDKRLITRDDSPHKYYNIYQPPVRKRVEGRDKIGTFVEHMKYLFNDTGDAAWMVSWMAQLIQSPDVRYRVAPLSISTYHGTGRGWLGQLLQHLVGRSNMSTMGMITDLVRDGAKSGFMDDKTLCLVSETYAGSNNRKYSVDNKLRQLLGDNLQNVDVKYGAQKDKQIYTRFWFQSNHVNGLSIDEMDNRIEVFINTKPPRSGEYYTRLYKTLSDKDFLDQVYSYLMNFDYKKNMYAKKWLTKSRKSKAREIVISANKSETANAFYAFKLLMGAEFFTDAVLSKFMNLYIGTSESMDDYASLGINNKELNHLKRDQLLSNETFGGKTYRSFYKQNLPPESIKTSFKQSLNRLDKYMEQKL